VNIDTGLWDLTLVVVVTIHATSIAYLTSPRWKAALTTLPLPFTVAVLAVARPVGPSNVLGLLLLFIYLQQVRWLHNNWSMPIVLAIGLSALTYCALGTLLNRAVPDTDVVFWTITVLIWLLALALLLRMPFRLEAGHRSPLPIYIKIPIVVTIVCALLFIKELLQGFITVFPMVTIVAAYEARHSLWTLGRQVPVLLVAMVPMIAAIRIVEGSYGIGPGLLAGWAVFLALYVPISWTHLFRHRGIVLPPR
jgi:hypothetical protein